MQFIDQIENTSHPYVFMFHGFGADMHDLYSLGDLMNPDHYRLNWIFPNGIHTVPIGPGWTGRAWWPLKLSSLPGDWSNYAPENFDQLIQTVMRFIESYKLPWNQVIFAGFSQGAMLATQLYLSAPQTPLALMSLSGSLINSESWNQLLTKRQGEKIFLSHGEQDQVLPIKGTNRLLETLKKHGLQTDFVSFQGGHEIPPQVCMRAKKYLTELLEQKNILKVTSNS